VRSGDIARGNFDRKSGNYIPSKKVHPKYWLYPTSYYTSVYRYIQEKNSGTQNIYVLCQDLENPTCQFFSKLVSLDSNLHMRTGTSLSDDIRLLLCAQDAAISRGTFQIVLALSMHMKTEHGFILSPSDDSLPLAATALPGGLPPLHPVLDAQRSLETEMYYFFRNEDKRKLYVDEIIPWTNSAYQRFLVNGDYEMSWRSHNKSI